MSNYNSQLQSNNIDLQTVLQTLQTKAAGAVLPKLANEGSASDLLYGKQLIGQEGNIVEGAIETFDGSYECSENEIITCPSLTIYGTLITQADDITLNKIVYYSGGKLQTLTGFYDDEIDESGLEHNLLNEPYIIQNVDVDKLVIIDVETGSAHPFDHWETSENINALFTSIPGETDMVIAFTVTNNNPATINFLV